jgi:hypothetical protein
MLRARYRLSRCRRRDGRARRTGARLGGAVFMNDRKPRAHFRRHAFRDEDFSNDPVCRRWNLGTDFVGFDVEQSLIGFHRIADFLVPLGNDALGNGFAELRHDHIHRVS